MIATERDSGRAPDGPPTEVIAGMLLEFNDRLLERYTIGGKLGREQLREGAEAVWLRTIYGRTDERLREEQKPDERLREEQKPDERLREEQKERTATP
jgi:hypothetical protein